jgi:hypothetical protein
MHGVGLGGQQGGNHKGVAVWLGDLRKMIVDFNAVTSQNRELYLLKIAINCYQLLSLVEAIQIASESDDIEQFMNNREKEFT